MQREPIEQLEQYATARHRPGTIFTTDLSEQHAAPAASHTHKPPIRSIMQLQQRRIDEGIEHFQKGGLVAEAAHNSWGSSEAHVLTIETALSEIVK